MEGYIELFLKLKLPVQCVFLVCITVLIFKVIDVVFGDSWAKSWRNRG